MLEKYHRVYAEVDLDALHYNLKLLQSCISPDTKIMGIIKADGYGHGAVAIGRELEGLSFVYGYGVATAEEALILRRAGLKKPILILGYTFPYCYEDLIREDIRPTVFRLDMLKQLAECAEKSGKKARIHIKVDTGMTRIGIQPDESGIAFVKEALAYDWLEIEGVYTHLARADEEEKVSAKKQIDQISQFMKRIETQLGYSIPIKHCSNSAGIIQFKEANMDIVRAGIALYGLCPSKEVGRNQIPLQPVLSLKSHIVYTKWVARGTPVSYGGTYVTEKDMRIATIPVGYGDGYPRGLSGKGYVLIHGKKAPILGRICMDQFMVSIDDIPEANEGDEVTLIGEDSSLRITMEELGEISRRFNYELACNLGQRIPRIYRKGDVISNT